MVTTLAGVVCMTGRLAMSATKPIVVTPRKPVAFSVAGRQASKTTTYTVDLIKIGDRTFDKALGNMALNARSGEFSWTPTESQAGAYEVTFLAKEATGETTRTTRRITVQPGPAATGSRKTALRVQGWYAAGTAAGNTGDFYDNRDGGHSPLRMQLFPQLDRTEYTDEQKKRRLHWGAQLYVLFPHVTMGNSSTAAPAAKGGCNTRLALTRPGAARILYAQYRRNHLYIYPEHRDYDPGHNGRGGYGDLFPANTPYVITSQGSSGTDRTFMQAVAYTLAAFRPEVKQQLVRTGLLMPTVQMIFRRCNTNVKHKKDYLTGEAHRVVFDGRNVNDLAMVEMAHDITLKTIPPMIQLAVIEEDLATPGLDFFAYSRTETLFDTPAAVARVARSSKRVRRMVVSAETSSDVNGRKLTYHWVVLQGDPKLITVKPLNAQSSRVELLIAHHPRRPIAKDDPMQTNRVDIGAFVSNGTYYSAPGFVSVFFLDNEARTYDAKGRILEIDYAHGSTQIGSGGTATKGGEIKDYRAFVEMIAATKRTLPAELLRKQFSTMQRKAFQQATGELRSASTATMAKILTKQRSELDASVAARIEDALNALKNDLNFTFANAPAIDNLLAASKDASRKQAAQKALKELKQLATELAAKTRPNARQPFPTDRSPADQTLGRYHQSRIQKLNIAVMQNALYPGLLAWRGKPNFVPPRIAAAKPWRDVYRYAPDGRLIGWTRHRASSTEQFTAHGALVVKTDPQGRPILAQAVSYQADRTTTPWSLKQLPTNATLRYTYASTTDLVGRLKN